MFSICCMRATFFAVYSNISLLSYRTVPNLQGDIHITPFALDIVGIEYFCIPTFQDAALATSLAIVKTSPGFKNIGLSFFFGGIIYLWWLHSYILLVSYYHLNDYTHLFSKICYASVFPPKQSPFFL